MNIYDKLKHKKKKKKKKTYGYDTVSELYNDFLETYFDEYYDLSDAERKNIEHKHKPKSYFLKDIIMMTGLKMKNQLIKKNL